MGMHILRAACGVSSLVFGAYAVTRIPLANVQAIAMTNGVFTVLFASIFLKEHVGWREVLSGSVALGGAVLVAGPGSAGAAGWALLGVLETLLRPLPGVLRWFSSRQRRPATAPAYSVHR